MKIKGNPDKIKQYRAHKDTRLAKTATGRKVADRKKAQANSAEVK